MQSNTANGKMDNGQAARVFAASPADEICISGVSGQFPSSHNVTEFEENLYNKVDMITEELSRWPHYHSEIPKRMGNIFDIDRFDAQFFGVNTKQAEIMDPQGRLLLERAYEAITDAGVNPKQLRGSRTGVYIGACFAESEKTWFYDRLSERGFGITGCSRAMLANRISYSFGLEGPSFLLDTACSSSMYALDAAFTAIRSGQCDAAIVGGANLLLNPHTSIQFARLGVLAPDGYCRPFDASASGYVRAEAVCALFLQKARDAKRIYATVVYSKTNCDGYKLQGITYPSGRVQQNLLTEFYADLAMDARTVDYVEAHSTGTVAGDPEECIALDKVFCTQRKQPLLVGSVKSNIGHTESSSGVCSIAKVILALERGEVAPNINFTRIREEIAALGENRMQVCTEVSPLPANALVAINSFGFGGANAHCLVRGHTKRKLNNGAPADDLPRLVCWAGRTKESIEVMMDCLLARPLDAELVGLLHNIQGVEEPGFMHRGYGLLAKSAHSDGTALRLASDEQRFDGEKRPLVWIFSGMGSQWPQMGASLLGIPLFRESIERSQQVMRPYGIDLMEILTAHDDRQFDDIVISFLGIAAVQIALVDILQTLGQRPDYMIGHSVGELGCGYADGALSAEQMLLAAYWRGRSSQEAHLEAGGMAAIGLSHRSIRDMLPDDIDIACHNSAESCTISGPAESVKSFVRLMQAKNVFAREVNSSGIAYHSRYVRPIADRLLANTRDFCPPVRRSERWLSTSVPRSQWHLPQNQMSCAQYYVNNLLNSVLFEETVALLPANAIAVEIAPHGLLQAIVKKSLPQAVHVPLTQRKSTNSASHFLIALGKLFLNGITMPLEKLYPAIEFPVSSGTLKIASLMRWDHSDSYFVTNFSTTKTSESGEIRVSVSLEENGEFEYVAGHKIDGRCLFPATGYLELVWITLARMCGTVHHLLNVEFENVQFLRATALRPNETVELNVMVHYGNGTFEVSEGRNSIVTGTVRTIPDADSLFQLPVMEDAPYPDLVRDEFYKELRLRGYQYSGAFRSVERARSDGHCGRICWDMNWVSFMDCMLQIGILARDTRALMLPTRIQKVRIFPTEHQTRVMQKHRSQNNTVGPILCDVINNQKLKIIQAGGVEMHNVETNLVSRRKPPGDLVLESYQFVPLRVDYQLSHIDAVRVLVQLVLENYPNLLVLRALEDLEDATNVYPLLLSVDDVLRDVPLVKGQLTVFSADHVDNQHHKIDVLDATIADQRDAHLIISSNSLERSDLWELKLTALLDGGYAIVRTSAFDATNSRIPNGFELISTIPTDREYLILLRKIQPTRPTYKTISLSNKSFDWLTELQESIQTTPVLLVAQNDQHSGILGLVNCIRREPATKPICCVFVDDLDAPNFDAEMPFYEQQLRSNLLMNVYKNGAWGTYRHLQLPQPQLRLTLSSHQIAHCYANVMRNGDLSSIAWLQGPLRIHSDASANDSLVRVQYASINFRDVMLATGRLSAEEILDVQRVNCDCVLGMEYAGTMRDGRRMMGVVPSGAMATLIRPFKPLMWSVPEQWSLREAATVPIVYMTVYSAFFLGQPIAAGKSILIHAGSGGVGLAAIRVALAYGLEVFTTVSNAQKQHYIMQKFPQLKECNIGNSRDCSFEHMIKLRTGGDGVDFVLNSLSDDKLVASVRCLGRAGVFLEIGKFDLANDTKLGLGVFLKEMSFRSVLADNLSLPSHIEQTRYIHQLIERDMCTGVIVPLDASVFGVLEVEKAYRYLSTGQHVGKVLVQICDDDQPAATAVSVALPRVYFEPQRVYVVAGGLGGFGLELIDWLVLRGARRVLIASSRGITTKYQVYRMRIWQSYGCNIHVSTADMSSAGGCRELLRQAGQLGSVAGIFNLAVRLRDGLLLNQSEQTFRECAAPKSDATAALDALSRQLYPANQLAHFVVFSSVTCGRGNAGQSNYGWTNAIMERIVERRVADGLAGKAIQWGFVGDVGLAAQMFGTDTGDVEIAGTQTQRIASCLVELDALLTGPEPIVSSMVLARKNRCESSAMDKQKLTMLESVLNIMSIRNMNTISMGTSMSELGMDSLMTIEIKQALEREFDVLLTTQDLRAMTFQQLQQLSAQKSSNCGDGLAELIGDSLEQRLKLQQQQRSRMIDLRTLLANTDEFAASQMRREKLYELKSGVGEQVWICMPGIEGDYRRVWQSIADRTNATTYILKYGETASVQSLQEMADVFAQAIQMRFPDRKHFSLVGYSFGSLLALEVARRLERSGQHGHIVCVDGSPEFLRQLFANFIAAGSQESAKFTPKAFENCLATTLIHHYVPAADLAEVSAHIEAQTEWPSKIDKVLEYVHLWLADSIDFDAQFVRVFATGVQQRVLTAMEYIEQTQGMQPIGATMTLLRAGDSKVCGLDDSYDLRKYTSGKVSVQIGAGNHQTILNNPILCDILNSFRL